MILLYWLLGPSRLGKVCRALPGLASGAWHAMHDKLLHQLKQDAWHGMQGHGLARAA